MKVLLDESNKKAASTGPVLTICNYQPRIC